jgi:carbonic anhydrase/acetyltransferase-like protein (isoleucine patch superfamily)
VTARPGRPRRPRPPAVRPDRGGAPRAARAPGIAFGPHHPRIHPSAFVTEGAYVVGRVTVAARASIWFGAVLRADFEPIRVGADSLIEDNVVVHGRVVVGRRCVIGHGAILHGCTVADGAVIGSNAVVFDGARIGERSLVAAGSVVYPNTRVPPRVVFRNSAGGNHPVVEPIGHRLGRWEATSYRRIIATYRSGGAGRAPGAPEVRGRAPVARAASRRPPAGPGPARPRRTGRKS